MINVLTEKYAKHSEGDRLFLQQLGIAPKRLKRDERQFVGAVKIGAGKIEIYATPMPAMFWKIDIYSSNENSTVTIETGSGNLSEFWPIVDLIARNRIAVTGVLVGNRLIAEFLTA